MINDVARAFFEAPARRKVAVELPEEEKAKHGTNDDEVGVLQMSLDGTRDASANFEDEIKKVMTEAESHVNKYNATTFYHKGRDLETMVRGVHCYVTGGKRKSIKWLEDILERRFEVSNTIVGHGKGEVQEARMSNRGIRVNDHGRFYEAD